MLVYAVFAMQQPSSRRFYSVLRHAATLFGGDHATAADDIDEGGEAFKSIHEFGIRPTDQAFASAAWAFNSSLMKAAIIAR
ncbi:hypothetical protein ALP49_200069 [Pseudomonas syringae pv. solidagae]|nr:hypothetical protein ALP49_200069 [Pseudomonas syringae pv. solidagae]